MSDIAEFMQKQEQDSRERGFRMAITRARNAMMAVRIAIEEGDTDEAMRLIDEALDEPPNVGVEPQTTAEKT